MRWLLFKFGVGLSVLALSLVAPASSLQGDLWNSPGYKLLTEKAYLPPDFDQETFERVWEVWPEPLRSRAARASAEERRAMAFRRYGLSLRPHDESGKPLQYVVGADGKWTMNCFACHGGTVQHNPYLGAPNSRFALETLTADIRQMKLQLRKPLTRMDVGSLVMPLGTTNGTTNAVMFGVALMAFRDAKLNILRNRLPPAMVHHDMDAPPWWHFHRKSKLYIDGFAPKGHRGLMQFMLVEENGPDRFREWESDFRQIFKFISDIRPPSYPFPIDRQLARKGQQVFERTCSECHGTYGQDADFPEREVSWDLVGTDRVRLTALTAEHRQAYADSWFNEYGKHTVVTEPVGYVAPPLDGIWASAPYFHNGSVPTLWHLLHPDQRPVVWTREDGFDRDRVGLPHASFDELPSGVRSAAQRRNFFDTRRFGKSAAGHDFADVLTPQEKAEILEYLKTL